MNELRSHLSALSGRLVWLIVALLLATQAGMLGWIGYRKSPGVDEPAHLASGLSHWKFGRFDLYRVNPPLVRTVATIPLLVVEPKTDWSSFTEAPYARPEFALGGEFTIVNGFESFWYFTLCRWACIPIVLLGGLVCFLWASELYGRASGIASLILWIFCPNVLGNGAMITPDVGGASFGVAAGYAFWRWLRAPDWKNTLLAGLGLGLAEMSKSTWIVLFGLWPVLWVIWRILLRLDHRSRSNDTDDQVSHNVAIAEKQTGTLYPSLVKLFTILAVGIYLLNLSYGFENSFQRLDKFQFISQALGGMDAHEKPGNRFAESWLGHVPVPVPANYVAGIDVQRFDFEKKKWSYLRGEQKFGGWWYYSLYAMAVKMPVGTLAIMALAALSCLVRLASTARGGHRKDLGITFQLRDDVVVLAPGLVLLILVSSQTGFSRYLRYVIPAFPFFYVWSSQVVALAFERFSIRDGSHRSLVGSLRLALPATCLLWSVGSSAAVLPHSLSYFNELAGGPENGPAHLLDANIDWGQDLLELKRWCDRHPDAHPMHLAYFGFIDPRISGIDFTPARRLASEPRPNSESATEQPPEPGWYAISVNDLYAYNHVGIQQDDYASFRKRHPVDRAGHSIYIYYVEPDEFDSAKSPRQRED